MIEYKVRVADTLWSIAKRHNVTVETLVSTNDIKNPDLIRVGQVLKIPVSNNALYNALITCLEAVEALPEFKTLMELIGK